jgi:hypothetical protein
VSTGNFIFFLSKFLSRESNPPNAKIKRAAGAATHIFAMMLSPNSLHLISVAPVIFRTRTRHGLAIELLTSLKKKIKKERFFLDL